MEMQSPLVDMLMVLSAIQPHRLQLLGIQPGLYLQAFRL
jgi:hypothetical protein